MENRMEGEANERVNGRLNRKSSLTKAKKETGHRIVIRSFNPFYVIPNVLYCSLSRLLICVTPGQNAVDCMLVRPSR